MCLCGLGSQSFLKCNSSFNFFFLCRKLLSDNKHVKYLYIPYTDKVVIVTCNPLSKWKGMPKHKPKYTAEEAMQPIRDLYQESLIKYR